MAPAATIGVLERRSGEEGGQVDPVAHHFNYPAPGQLSETEPARVGCGPSGPAGQLDAEPS